MWNYIFLKKKLTICGEWAQRPIPHWCRRVVKTQEAGVVKSGRSKRGERCCIILVLGKVVKNLMRSSSSNTHVNKITWPLGDVPRSLLQLNSIPVPLRRWRRRRGIAWRGAGMMRAGVGCRAHPPNWSIFQFFTYILYTNSSTTENPSPPDATKITKPLSVVPPPPLGSRFWRQQPHNPPNRARFRGLWASAGHHHTPTPTTQNRAFTLDFGGRGSSPGPPATPPQPSKSRIRARFRWLWACTTHRQWPKTSLRAHSWAFSTAPPPPPFNNPTSPQPSKSSIRAQFRRLWACTTHRQPPKTSPRARSWAYSTFHSAAATACQQPNKPTTPEIERSRSLSWIVGFLATTPHNPRNHAFTLDFGQLWV